MGWFDGTFETEQSVFNEKYPVRITRDLYASANGMSFALLNRFAAESEQYRLADPHKEERMDRRKPFYHVFAGQEAKAAEEAICTLIADHATESCDDLTLYRADGDAFFSYGGGHICKSLLSDQQKLRKELPEPLDSAEVFILPLKVYLHRCPVCKTRSLECRGAFEICYQCGWEDEGIDDPDEEPIFGPNGEYTIRRYREKYDQMVKEDPSYCWESFVEEG